LRLNNVVFTVGANNLADAAGYDWLVTNTPSDNLADNLANVVLHNSAVN